MNPTALIVSHGQPSDPDPAEAELALLAGEVAALLPDWDVRAATLAKPGALEAAVKGGPGVVYPMFMAGGWFTKAHLPQRMAEVGAAGWHHLPPFGLDAAVHALCVGLAMEAAAAMRRAPAACDILLAAHGSLRSPAPSEVANAMTARLRGAGFARAEAYFIDQDPRIATARGFGTNALCLPFFAAKGGHVVDDLPKALSEAGFAGTVLPPLGLDRRVPGLIARAIAGWDSPPPAG
ncbi:MAG: cobalamin biosynthesis protein CbiX [Paracoccaceae bacterium]